MTAAGVSVGVGGSVGLAGLPLGDSVEVAEVSVGAADVEGDGCAMDDAGVAVATDGGRELGDGEASPVEHAESASSPRSTPRSATARNGIDVIGLS